MVATDLYRRQQAVQVLLRRASGRRFAASIALPTVMRPVMVNEPRSPDRWRRDQSGSCSTIST